MADMAGRTFPLIQSSKNARIAGAVCCAVMALACLCLGLWSLLDAISMAWWGLQRWLLLPFLTVGAFWLAGFFFLLMDRRLTRIEVTEEGICVLRPLRRDQWLPWSAFQQVCIEQVTSRWTGKAKPPMLCFIRHGEKQNRYGAWRVDEPWHYRRILAADCAEELHAAVSACCPDPIADLRGCTDAPAE